MNYLSKHTLRRTLVLTITSVAVIATSMSGCKKTNPLGLGGCDDVVRLSESYVKAWQAFADESSVANCEKLKKTLQDYFKAAKKCTLYPNYLEEVEEAQRQVGDLNCSEVANN